MSSRMMATVQIVLRLGLTQKMLNPSMTGTPIDSALSNVVVEHESLFPVRSGLELAYGRQLNQRRAATLGRRAIKEIGPIAFCLDFDNNFSFGTQQGNEEGVEVRLHNVLELFAGRRPPSINSNFSATCLNGLCAFLGILLEPNEDRNSVARIHILAGRILFEKKSQRPKEPALSRHGSSC
jgi:hypothetical protein